MAQKQIYHMSKRAKKEAVVKMAHDPVGLVEVYRTHVCICMSPGVWRIAYFPVTK